MSKISIKLTSTEWRDLIDEIAHWGGVKLTVSQMKTILKKKHNIPLFASIANGGMDTSDREQLLDEITDHLGMKEAWPIGSTPERTSKKFFQKFYQKAKKAGYRIASDT